MHQIVTPFMRIIRVALYCYAIIIAIQLPGILPIAGTLLLLYAIVREFWPTTHHLSNVNLNVKTRSEHVRRIFILAPAMFLIVAATGLIPLLLPMLLVIVFSINKLIHTYGK
jgi:hypothetical protein